MSSPQAQPQVQIERYPSGAVRSEFPMNAEGTAHGLVKGFFENGKQHWECEYRDGQSHGTLRYWYETGALQSTRAYLHGMKHGAFRDWHRNGQRASEGEYRADELIAVREWDEHGRELPDALARWQQAAANAPNAPNAADAPSPAAAWTAPTRTGNEMLDPAWQQRQMQLGEVFLALWLMPWAQKRQLIEQEPDLAEVTRHLMVRLVLQRSLPADALALVENLAAAHQPLIERCECAVGQARSTGGDLGAALDEVFDDHALWLAFHARTGQPQD